MPDIYSIITTLDQATQERIAAVLETRGADPQQQTMRESFLSVVPFPPNARVLEIGCGTGVLTRRLARWPNIAEVVGVDPAVSFLEHARRLAAGLPNVTFQEADGRALAFSDASFDAVVIDSALSHVPEPERAIGEAGRVLRPAGILAIFDGDYATATVALGDDDPLQTCVAATLAHSVHDRWLARRLPGLVRAAGFAIEDHRNYGYLDVSKPDYMLTIIDRGADILAGKNILGVEASAAMKAEARRRAEAGIFFGQVMYASVVTRKV
jgi:ubiquinone/menaquinone biosynthesis C-methylase UbiE